VTGTPARGILIGLFPAPRLLAGAPAPRSARGPLRAARSQSKDSRCTPSIKTGGKQYRVAAGETIKVERLAAEVGHDVKLDQVVAIGSGAELVLGAPLVAGASVVASVVSHGRHPKVRIFKMRKRKHYRKSQGQSPVVHRDQISAVNPA
jgi:large subunit ribosomal protein L21